MNTSELLRHLSGLGVRIWTDRGELKCSAPEGVLTPELQGELSARKAEILTKLGPDSRDAEGREPGTDSQPGPISRVPRDIELPLSFAQQRLWFLQQIDPDLVAYTIPLSWSLIGPLDVDALEGSLTEIVRRHEVLRSTFVEKRGVPMLQLGAAEPVTLELILNRDSLPEDEWRRRVSALIVREAGRPFDLRRGPLFRTSLLRINAEEHVLFVPVHHAIFDGVSIGIFLRELMELYEARVQGRAAVLAPLSIQYVDYAVWQNESFGEAQFKSQLDYWREKLSGELPRLDLPTDRPRPAVQTFAGAQAEVSLPKDLIQELTRLGQGEGATLYMTMLAAFKLLLHRISSQEDLIVGTAISGRNHPDVEGLLGFFVNTLVLRTDLSGEPSFRELIGRVRDVCYGAYENYEVPFERLVDELSPERNLAYSPIFQVMFLNETEPDAPTRKGGISVKPYGSDDELDFHVARNDLTFWTYREGDKFVVWAEFNTDLFDKGRIERMLGHYKNLLVELAGDPDRALHQYSILGSDERRQVLEDWNRTSAPYPEQPIHAQFEAQVQRTPDAPALIFPAGAGADEELSYSELDRRANQLARHLTAQGVKPGELVGVCLERSAELVVSLLGILKTGAAYVPLDPSYPRDRIAYMIEDSGLALVVTTGALADLVPAPARGVCLDTDAEQLASGSDAPGGVEVAPSDRMYVIYTSGSTGRPKGVELEHRSVSNFLASMAKQPGLSAGERLLAVTTPSFDISVLELFCPLMVGGTVIVAPQAAVNAGDRLLALLQTQRPQVMQATPATWRMLLLCGWKGEADLRIFCGGEAFPTDLAEELLACGKEVWNLYGPTEATIWSAVKRVVSGQSPVPIGRPIASTRIYILDAHMQPVPIGVPGELYIGGDGLARGYLGRPELTAERFLADPFVSGERIYRTGDLARYRADGEIECLGRIDNQVKLRGFRIELGEIESVLAEAQGIEQCVCVVREDRPGDQRLTAYFVGKADEETLRARAREHLPAYMVPAAFVELQALPLTPNGKVDRKALLALRPVGAVTEAEQVEAQNELERRIAETWCEVLGVEGVSVTTNFFDLGGHSLLLARVHSRLREDHPELSIIELFQFPTVRSLATHLGAAPGQSADRARRQDRTVGDIAIVGMAGRFPGARDVAQFWSNLREGVESIRFFTPEELLEAGVDPALIDDPDYVNAHGHLDDIDLFDAAFFDISPREAEVTDPQRRFLLECAWEALEDSATDPDRYPGAIGLFAGTSANAYIIRNLIPNPGLVETVGHYSMAVGNFPDFLATGASYKLNLRGPSMTVQTACSTSLVAVHLACQSLLTRESDMALAGGVGVSILAKEGYLFVQGGTASPDGHVRTFDAKGEGMLGGNGVGLVVLKRLEDALADGDSIRAVIKASALNNDGLNKVSFTAPSVEGEARVIDQALELSGVDPATITMVEAHGTATPLGDPIEIAALTQAWRRRTDVRGTCAIGSVKTNIGHLDIAAGVAGLIKATLSLEHREIPPSLNFETPNPEIDFDSSPFFVNAALRPWESDKPRRAAVSSFGMGGTNAHAILEQAPELEPSSGSRPWQVLLLSARAEAALEAGTTRLADHLEAHPGLSLADVAYTTQVGRKAFEHRRSVVCRDLAEGIDALRKLDKKRVTTHRASAGRAVAFLFTGQGAQYPNMARGLYESEPVFRDEVDRCCELLRAHLGRDLRELLLPEASALEAAAKQLELTQNTQPALFVIEYALAELLRSWGVAPQAMVGHSIGEYVAACQAGVFALEDALRLVAARGRLIGSLPEGGAMAAIHLAEAELTPLLPESVGVAAINAPGLCVVSGPAPAVDALAAKLEADGVGTRRLHTSHAFHSHLMDPILEAFAAEVAKVELKAPRQRFVSCSTGTWISAEEATDPEYWVRHIRQPVRFADCVQTLLADSDAVLLEVGPGQTLTSLARLCAPEAAIVSTVRHPREEADDLALLSGALGELWSQGATIDWQKFHSGERRLRVPLPTYAFQGKRYWIDPPGELPGRPVGPVKKSADIADWFFVPSWRRTAPPVARREETRDARWLIFADRGGLADSLASELTQGGGRQVVVRAGSAYARSGEGTYTLAPGDDGGYLQLIEDLHQRGELPDQIVHMWGTDAPEGAPEGDALDAAQESGFYSLLFLAQALSRLGIERELRIDVVTRGMQDVLGGELEFPEKATVLGACQAIGTEVEGLSCRSIDTDGASIEALAAEICSPATDPAVAYRGTSRWTSDVDKVKLDQVEGQPRLRQDGVYLVTGGLGGIGLTLAEHLARGVGAKLVLTARSALPARETWDAWLAEHPDEDGTSLKIGAVRRLEELGAEVLTLAADVTDADAMRAAIEAARQRFGALHGVVHSAGVPGAGLIELKTRATARAVLAPKLRGTRILHELLADEPLDFMVLCSSIATAILSVGQVDYIAANAYLNAFAQHARSRHRTPVISVGWDAWQEVGMAANTAVPEMLRQARDESLRMGIAPAEGSEAFRRLLSAGLPHVYVSARDLPSREDYRPASETEVEVVENETSAGTEAQAAGDRSLSRPALSTEYVAPSNETEEAICGIWGNLLGVDPVGVRDNFFELGGNSLVMMQLNVRLRSVFGVSLPMHELFGTHEVADLARKVASVRDNGKQGRTEELTL